MGSSSRDATLVLTEASSVVELERFIRGKCSHVTGMVLKKLIAAAVTTMVCRRTIYAFRTCRFIAKEGHGALYHLVKQLAPPPPTKEDELDANPLVDFKSRYPTLPLPEELDFLLKGYEKERVKCTLDFDLGLTGDEAKRVALALSSKQIPDWLMEPCTFLTFEENLDARVQVARLWISASKLPIYAGSNVTFEQLSQMKEPPQEPADFAVEENLPSKFQIRMREETLMGMHWSKTMGWTLSHPTPDELPDICVEFSKCYARLRYPVTISELGCSSYGRITGDVEIDKEEFLEDREWDLHDIKVSETPRMYKRLAALLYQVQVE